MSARNSNQHKYSNAGEQAGRVISEFISIADNFSKRFEKEFSAKGSSCHRSPDNSTSDSAPYTKVGKDYQNKGFSGQRETAGFEKSDLENEWRNAGEYLRELREAAGYTVDGFAKAINRHDAAGKIKSVEEGRDVFPEDWLDQMSALLKQNDPLEFFEKLRNLYGAEPQADTPADTRADGFVADAETVAGVSPVQSGASDSSVASQRREKLQNIFSDDQLEGLSDSQFEELLSFVEINCQSALQLVRRK